jgi:glycosyltransferase involved in cell wall biosynthesis
VKNPLVSVVIPTYNRAELVCRAIDNVFQQTYSDIEIIVVDDGSTDDTQSRLRQYGSRIRVIAQANTGAPIARNRGAAAARGEIIAFQDSDDSWKPSKLERQVALLANCPKSVPCCLCNVAMGILDGREQTSFSYSLIQPQYEQGLWTNVAEVLATRFVLFNQAAAIRRDAFEKLGGFAEDLKYLEDYDLPLRLALEGPWAYIAEPLVNYQQGTPGSFSSQASRDPIVLKECAVRIFERILAQVDDDGQRVRLRTQLKRRLRMIRRELVAAKLTSDSSLGQRAIGRCLLTADHYGRAAFRRSPWFPKPTTVPIKIVDSPLLQSS